MACSYWLLVTCALMFGVHVQGDELCYEDSWKYYGRHYSCFKRISTSLTWTAARDYCLQIQVGSSYGVTTRLAKIDDGPTNGFVRAMCAQPYSPCWIGMYYNDEKGDFRWDGYPDEEPSFRAVKWPDPQGPYVATMNDRWEGFGDSQTHHFVCGHGAKRISDVTCEDQLVANGLRVTCTSQKSPIRAACQWTYNYDGSNNFPPWQPVHETAVSSNESQTEPGDISFTTVCWITLKKVDPSPITIKMKMYADPANGPDLSGRNDVITVGRITIDIVAPDRPIFKLLDQTLQTSSPIHFSENDRIYLTCEVSSGKPSVYSVTLICDFPFTNSGVNNNNTLLGTTHVMDEMASRDMNGKNCRCIGNHVTGEKESLPLTFNVTFPPEVKDFTVNGQPSSLVVDLNETLTFSCLTDGNPLPSVNMRKLGTSYAETSAWLLSSRATGMKVEHVIEARCEHNGRYRCSAVDVENQLEDIQDLDVRVRCTPSYCTETSRDLKIPVKPGKFETVSLCVVAYPMPAFTLMKDSNTGWQTPEDLVDHVTQETSSAFQQLVTISFQELSPSHLGAYALQYSDNTSSSWLYFNLTAPLTPCKGEENVTHGVNLVWSVSVHLCVIAFPIPSDLSVRRAHETSKANSRDVNVAMQTDGDILTGVNVTFLNFSANDLGQYRLFDSQDTSVSTSSYLSFSLAVHTPEAESEGSSGNAGAIAGAVVSVVIVIAIVVIVVICIRRRKQTTDVQKKSANEGGAKKKKEKYGCDDYAKVDISMKRKGTKNIESKGQRSENSVQIYDNDGFVFQHRTSKDYDDETYFNMPDQNNTPDDKVPVSKTEKGDGDLVYIHVDITTDNKVKPQTKSKLENKPKKAKEDGGEGVEATEYVEISASATVRIRKEIEEEENDKMKGKGDGKENGVYANMPDGDNVP